MEGYYFPISLQDLNAVQDIIRQREIFCASVPEDFDIYDCLTWRRQAAHYETGVCAFFDRNVLNDVIDLVRSAELQTSGSCSERGRIGAAIMAFLQCSNIALEPNVALYEDSSRAAEELRLFRRADEVDSRRYTDIALQRRESIPNKSLPEPHGSIPEVDFQMRIKGHRNLRVAALKIAELELSAVSPVEKMERFLRWSYSHFLLLPGPIFFAGTYFAPRRQSTLLKNVRSRDRQKALEAVDNAVWDLQVMNQWTKLVRLQHEENRFWLLCSRDKALREIAVAGLYFSDEPFGSEEVLKNFFETYWGKRDANYLTDLTLTVKREKDNAERMVNRNQSSNYPDELASQLKASILTWRPN